MKRLIPYIAFACLTGFTATSGLPVMAGACSSHMNKKAGSNVLKMILSVKLKKPQSLN